MSGERKVPGRDELSKARVALVDKITELANGGGWPEDMVLVAAVLAGLREGTEAGDKIAMQLARRLPMLVGVSAGMEFEVAEWIALLRRAEAMDAALSITTETREDGTVARVTVAEVEASRSSAVDGMNRIMMFTGKVDGTEPTVVLRGEPKTGQSWWSGSEGERP